MVHLSDLERLRHTPAYPFSEAAHYLNLPVSTLRAWCLGQGGPQGFRPVIRLDGQPGEGLSFLNLIEAHVLAALRRVHGVRLARVRSALDYVARQLGVARPLADVQFQTDGVDLFVEQLDRLLNVSKEGQLEMASLLRAHLQRIERDPGKVPIKLYPFTTSRAAADAPAPIVIDPRIAFGRPVLRGKGVPTAVLADRFKAGDSLKELAGDYEAAPEDIEEAIRCELDRRAAA
jgi:uncharacterized protein (DUF433 family)